MTTVMLSNAKHLWQFSLCNIFLKFLLTIL